MTSSLAPAPAMPPIDVDLVRRTVAKDATDAELKLYLFDCARHGVHPLDKLLHFTKRKGKYTPITSIDLMRIRAHETGECIGITDPLFEYGEGRYPLFATVTVRRLVQGQVAEFTATARWEEYYPGDGDPGFMWRKMPHTMLGKCCEGLALRKGFPKQLAGLYAKEEMDQAGPVVAEEVESTTVESAPPAEPVRERQPVIPVSTGPTSNDTVPESDDRLMAPDGYTDMLAALERASKHSARELFSTWNSAPQLCRSFMVRRDPTKWAMLKARATAQG